MPHVLTTSFKPNQIDVFETEERSLPKLLMFRTSNSTLLFGYLMRHFSRIAAVASHDVFYDLVESERYLSRTAGAQYVMSNSFAFGGSNVSLILGR